MCLASEEVQRHTTLWSERDWMYKVKNLVEWAFSTRRVGRSHGNGIMDFAHFKAEEEVYWVLALQELLGGKA